MTPDEARTFLSGLSFHRNRPGDVAYMNPDFAVRLATAIQQAKAQGLQVSLLSGYREPSDHPSAYDLKQQSSHEYGLAADVSGIGAAGSSTALQWAKIAAANGLSNPYGQQDAAEYNHWQLPPQPLETSPQLLDALKAGKATGDVNKMWAAYDPKLAASAVAQGADNRQIFFDALVKAGLSPQQALGALWGLAGESGPSLNTAAYNPNDPGGSVGAGQWNGPRRWALEEIAQREGKPVTDPQVQAEYLVGELTGNLQGAVFQPGVLDALKKARTPEEAARIWVTQYERPKIDNSDRRIANGSAVGSLDANGHFVPGTAKAAASGAGGVSPRTGAAPAPPSDLAQIGSALSTALGSLAGGVEGITSGAPGAITDASMDQPAIRAPALGADFTPPPANPVPANIAAGVGATPLASQLGMLAATPSDPMLENPNVAPSITAGAPGMTAMLGVIGGAQPGNPYDPRRPAVIQPGLAFPRLG
jgi:hypothetical protein